MSTVAVCAVAFGSDLSGIWYLPWVAGLLLFGLPHGACDHLVASKLTGQRSGRSTFVFVSVYLGAAALVLVMWLMDPTTALLFFLAVTAWHWGSADAASAEEDETCRSLTYFCVASTARGVLVISAPVAFHPEQSLSAFGDIVTLFGETPAYAQQWILPLAVASLILSVTVETVIVVLNLSRRYRNSAIVGAVEVALLLILFYVVSPVVAVGLYFIFWHAWKHVLRVSKLLDDSGATSEARDARLASSVIVYHTRALPLTLVSLVFLVVLTLAFGTGGIQQLFGVYLILISALTAPHAALVFLWDIRGRYSRGKRTPVRTGMPS